MEWIGRYLVERTLGTGGTSRVLLARDSAIDRHVAIKVFLPELSAIGDILQQEARTLGALSHPNIVQIYDFISEKETRAIVMEYVDGTNLSDVLDRGPLSATSQARNVL